MLCSRLELDRARRDSSIRDVRAYSPHRTPLRRGERVKFCKPWQLIADCLRELDARAIGFDYVKSASLRKLRAAHKASYRELPELILKMREIKSRQEIAKLRRAAKIAVKGMHCAAELIEVGRSELEIAAEAEYAMRRAGSEGTSFGTIVASGRNSWLPHSTATRRRLRQGDLIIIDLGAKYEGYCSDMTRTFALSPTRKQLKLVELVKRAQMAAIARVRDGVRASAIDKVARDFISRAGYASYYLHSTGHGVGLEIHESPSLAPDSRDVLRKDMVTTVEPGIYLPGVGGARREDMVLVTTSGHEILA
jgi:Xaa-Pro aminopeptidase